MPVREKLVGVTYKRGIRIVFGRVYLLSGRYGLFFGYMTSVWGLRGVFGVRVI